MSRARKIKKQESDGDRHWLEKRESEPGSLTTLPEQKDAIGTLLGESADPLPDSRLQKGWRRFRWLLLLLPIGGVLVPGVLWWQFQSANVTSSNAAVRGHLAEIGTRISGQVVSVEVDVGDRVKAGDVLVRLDDRHLRAEVQEMQAEISGLQRSIEVERMAIELERREIEQQRSESEARVAAAQAQADAARIQVEDAARAFELRESLYSRDGAVSSEDVRGADSNRRSAQARLEEAQANADAARSMQTKVGLARSALVLREQRIGVLEADLQRAEARLARAEADLDGALIRAPEDGAIVRRITQPGGSVEVGQPIISMWLGDELWVEAWIDEEEIGAVRLGSNVMVTLHSFPGQEFVGEVDKIGLATDLEIPAEHVPQPRFARMRSAPVVGVRIRLLDPPPQLLPGLTAVVAIGRQE